MQSVPEVVRLRGLLKTAVRRFGFRCVEVKPVHECPSCGGLTRESLQRLEDAGNEPAGYDECQCELFLDALEKDD